MMEIFPWRGYDLSYELKSWFHLLRPFPKLMLFQTRGDSPVLVMELDADLGTPSVSLLSVSIFCCFYKAYTASANSASRAKPCNFIRGRAGGGCPQLRALPPGDRVTVFLLWAVVASCNSLVGEFSGSQGAEDGARYLVIWLPLGLTSLELHRRVLDRGQLGKQQRKSFFPCSGTLENPSHLLRSLLPLSRGWDLFVKKV